MVKIGQRVRYIPAQHPTQYANGDAQFVEGVVTYVNRKHGWYLVETYAPFGARIREAFRMRRSYVEKRR